MHSSVEAALPLNKVNKFNSSNGNCQDAFQIDVDIAYDFSNSFDLLYNFLSL